MKTTIVILTVYILSYATISFAQQDTTWSKWNWLVGDWVGEGGGTPGQGSGRFSFFPDLNGEIMVRKSHSEYPATGNKPEIVHDDLMVVYLDDTHRPSKAIYFDSEGHTIDYAITYFDKEIIFTSNKVLSAPAFRLTYISLDTKTVDVKFEMSQDGKKFMTYTEGKCVRKK